ncbi:pilin [Wohlfahrtiimonas larvae]|uniref:Pilin n=1 Tax=Wohlfahrtiimonas larvae TaxID=1157986 RepID=A0ABP9MPD4_9GAMM|nr:pilin [Wohlfahrtiimonas larvae]
MTKGFTLIELMIVVAIIGILSMIALPSYQDYTKRTYVSEGLALSSSVKMAAMETFVTTGTWPTTNTEAGLPNGNQIKGSAVHSIWISSVSTGTNNPHSLSAIVIIYNEKVVPNPTYFPSTDENISFTGNNYLALYPLNIASDTPETQGSIQWECYLKGSGLLSRWLPSTCRSAVDF